MKILSSEDIQKALVQQASNLKIQTEDALHKLKKSYAREHNVDLPSNFKLQEAYEALIKEGWKGDSALQRLLRKRKIRTLSGVTVVTVLTKPYPCPGKCVFCPTEPGMPKSYLSNEPGAMRAVLDDFHPRDQVATRLNSLTRQGHETDKIEMIVLGGTFLSYDKKYRTEFIKSLFDACNVSTSRTLKEAQTKNESARHRIIGLSIETRSDSITKEAIKHLRKLGVTKIQLGIQHLDQKILDFVKRGETTVQMAHAIKLLRDSGFKIAIHLMPNLPGSTPKKDLKMIDECFKNPDFKPDQIKLYPCVVVPYSELESWWKNGKYKSYSDKIILNLLEEMQLRVPEYVRIERLYRDIPGESILAGSRVTNMRQILEDRAKKDPKKDCHCIRCREIKGEAYNKDSVKLKTIEYEAGGGKEFFLSFVNIEDKLCALLRLRFPSRESQKSHFLPELRNAAIIRELHVYGAQVELGDTKKGASQHAGLGKRLLKEAESLAKLAGFPRLAVISGIGVRPYYKKQGYKLEGTYMTKKI
ncbi:MAG: tRNA uridine(34) 5-carboxymethylaminomethyl modification radical SAM/GNAT enzyme Elp3 [Candidatus Gracilibacteria bacterium]